MLHIAQDKFQLQFTVHEKYTCHLNAGLYSMSPLSRNRIIYIYIVCSILKHQLITGILDESGTCISNAISVSSRKCSI